MGVRLRQNSRERIYAPLDPLIAISKHVFGPVERIRDGPAANRAGVEVPEHKDAVRVNRVVDHEHPTLRRFHHDDQVVLRKNLRREKRGAVAREVEAESRRRRLCRCW